MYKFVATLTDSAPWIAHFKKQAGETIQWKTRPSNSVIILPEDISDKGVEDPTKIQTVTPIEQISKQAEATLTHEINTEGKQTKVATKSSRKKTAITAQRKRAGVKRKVGAITKHTKDIFTDTLKKNKTS
jgi:hypothetical protein